MYVLFDCAKVAVSA